MKKGKFLVVASLIACCSMLAACGSAETSSSADPTSSTTSSEPDSSEDSTSDYSSEDSSPDESSSDDSSSDDSTSSSAEEPTAATVTLTLADNLYAHVYLADTTAEEHPADTDERILGSNGTSYENYSADLMTGDYIFIENLNNYSIDYTLSTGESGTISETNGGLSGLIEITGDCAITLSATEEVIDPANLATITYVCEDANVYAYVLDAEWNQICGSNGDNYNESTGTIEIGEFIYIQNLNKAADYSITFADGSTASGSIAAYGEYSNSIEITGDCAITMTATPTSSISEVNNYSPSVISSLNFAEGDEHLVGEEVEYSFASTQYVYDAESSKYSYYITINGETYNPETVTTTEDAYYTVYSGSFIMPEEDVTIDLVYSSTTISDDSYITASWQGDSNVECLSLNGSVHYSANSSIYLILNKAAGVSISSISYSTDGGDTWTDGGATSGVWTNGGYTSSNLVYKYFYVANYFSAGDSVIFKANYTGDNLTYGIHFTNLDQVTINTGSYYADSMIAGETAYISYTGASGHYVSAAATIVDSDGNDVTTMQNSASTSYSSSLRFTMPESDVYITFNLGDQIEVKAEKSDYLATQISVRTSYSNASTEVSYVTPGATYYICAYAADGYILSGFTINDAEYTSPTTSSGSTPITYYRYTVPSDAESLTISAIISQGYVVSSGIDSTYASVRFGNSTATSATYAAGASVSITVTPTAYYSLDSVSVATESGADLTDLSITYGTSSASITFTMPEEGVSLSAEFTAKETVSLSLSQNETAAADGSHSGISIYGNSSSTSLSDESEESASFLEGESLSIYVYSADTSYDWAVYAVYSDGTQTALSTSTSRSGTISASCTVSTDMTGIYIEASVKVVLTVTYDMPSGVTATYGASSSSVWYASSLTTSTEGFGEIYSGYYCYVYLECSEAGKGANLIVTDEDGNEIDVDANALYDQDGWYCFEAPSKNFTVSAELVDTYSVTIDYGDISSDDVMIQDMSDYSDIESGSYYNGNSTIRIYNYSYSTKYYYVDYETGEDLSGSLTSSGQTFSFELTSNVTIYLSSSEITSSPAEDAGGDETTGGDEAAATEATIRYATDISTEDAYFDIENANDYTVYAGTEDGSTIISEATVSIGTSACVYCGYGSWGSSYTYTVDFDSEDYTDVTGTVSAYGSSDAFTIYGDCTITIALAA